MCAQTSLPITANPILYSQIEFILSHLVLQHRQQLEVNFVASLSCCSFRALNMILKSVQRPQLRSSSIIYFSPNKLLRFILMRIQCICNYSSLSPTNAQLISQQYVSQQSLCDVYNPTCLDIFFPCHHQTVYNQCLAKLHTFVVKLQLLIIQCIKLID